MTSEAPPLDDETIEAAAKAIAFIENECYSWKMWYPGEQNEFRKRARAALSAGLTQGGIVLREQLNKTRALLDACEREVRELSGDESDA